MKLGTRDLAKLGWPALAALVMIALAAAAVLWSAAGERQASARRDTAQSAKSQIEQRLRQVRTEEQEIKARTQQFLGMEERGMTGPEKRLDWTELLRDLQAQIGLPGMSYELSAQSRMDGQVAGGLAYHASTMKLQLQLLHEEDLLTFLARLNQRATALILVRSCKMARAAPSPASAPGSLLTAECQIDWITLARPLTEARP